VSQNEKVIKENPGVSDLWVFRDIRIPKLPNQRKLTEKHGNERPSRFARQAGKWRGIGHGQQQLK